ncbi:MAG: hypothetical protein PVH37_18890, partial [Desulfobacterales bacterium]
MRNPTATDFGTEPEKFLSRLDWLFLAGGRPESGKMTYLWLTPGSSTRDASLIYSAPRCLTMHTALAG